MMPMNRRINDELFVTVRIIFSGLKVQKNYDAAIIWLTFT
jgi:hypothetical protein